MFYLVLALLFSLLIAAAAIVNVEIVTVNYLFGEASLSLIVLILGSACAGALALGFFGLFRGTRANLRFREMRHSKEDLERRVDVLEDEKMRLEAELGRRQMGRQSAAVKEHSVESPEELTDPA